MNKVDDFDRIGDLRCDLAQRIQEMRDEIARKQRILPGLEQKLEELNTWYYQLANELINEGEE